TLLIPFLFTPVVNVVIAYFAMSVGLLHKTIGVAVPWTTPPLISGFLATGHISGVIWQIILIAVDVLCYLPFFLIMDKAQLDKEIN
ncbi:PTS sugar transporter subunit IIC, partial [Escherichia coli]